MTINSSYVYRAVVAGIATATGATDLGNGAFRVHFSDRASRDATVQELSAAQALADAEASAAAQLDTLRTQAIAAIVRLQQIQNAAAPTNAQIIAAIRDLATYEEKVIRVVFNTLS